MVAARRVIRKGSSKGHTSNAGSPVQGKELCSFHSRQNPSGFWTPFSTRPCHPHIMKRTGRGRPVFVTDLAAGEDSLITYGITIIPENCQKGNTFPEILSFGRAFPVFISRKDTHFLPKGYHFYHLLQSRRSGFPKKPPNPRKACGQ